MKAGPTAAELDEIDAEGEPDDAPLADSELDQEYQQLDGVLIRVKSKETGKKGTGVLEAWDGADQAQLREKLKHVAGRKVYVDLAHLRHLHEGTFEVFRQKVEDGYKVILLNPRPEVKNYAWFELFTVNLGNGMYMMRKENPEEQFGTNVVLSTKTRHTLQRLRDMIALSEEEHDEAVDEVA